MVFWIYRRAEVFRIFRNHTINISSPRCENQWSKLFKQSVLLFCSDFNLSAISLIFALKYKSRFTEFPILQISSHWQQFCEEQLRTLYKQIYCKESVRRIGEIRFSTIKVPLVSDTCGENCLSNESSWDKRSRQPTSNVDNG